MNGPDPEPFQRLFLAVAVPADVRQEIERAQSKLRRHLPPGAVRWTQPDQFHLTVKFLGDVPSEHIAALKESTAAVCATSPALRLSARGLGFFPSTRNPRVIWAGVNESEGQLSDLHRRLDEALRWLNPAEPPEKFAGHITLGRIKPGHHSAIPQLVALAADFGNRPFGEWKATEIEIIRSVLTAERAEHIPIARCPFGAP